jgi:TolB-like protein
MIKKIAHIIFILFCFSSIVFAEEKTSPSGKPAAVPEIKEKIFIYDFEDKNIEDKYAYLSSIIAGSISADLNRMGDFESKPLFLKIQSPDEDSSEKDHMDFLRELGDKAKEFNVQFLLTGSYVVDGTKITISCAVFDSTRQKLIEVEDTENKISAVLVEMIEQIADKVNEELKDASKTNKENKRREEEEKKVKISPFLGFYNTISGFTFGINYGRVDFHFDWADIYKHADVTSLYLSYELNNINSIKKVSFFKNTSLAGRYDHFSARNDGENKTRSQNLDLAAGSLSMSYLFRFNSYFNIAFSAGGGLSTIKLAIEPERDEFDNIISPGSAIKENNHLYATSALSLNFYLSNLKIESGFNYNIINFSPHKINYSVIYFGLGYRI